MSPAPTKNLVRLKQASAASGFAHGTLKRWVARGILRAVRPAGGRGWLLVDLDEVLRLRERPA